nr:glycosyltransferase [Bacillus coahuilensis]
MHVGYVGHMTNGWFDWDLIEKLAEEGTFHVHLIGHGAEQTQLENIAAFSSVTYYGKIPPTELYRYVRDWHVGLIPFRPHVLSRSVDPIKIYEYIYFGLPTVSSGMPHLDRYPHVVHAETHDRFIKACHTHYQSVLQGEEEYNPQTELFLEESQWTKRFDRMIAYYEHQKD